MSGASPSARRGALAGWAIIAAIALLRLVLVGDLDLVAVNAPHDDQWFLRKAESWYWGDGYGVDAFIKEPLYPLFAGLADRAGINLRLWTEFALLGAVAAFTAVAAPPARRPLAAAAVFAALAFAPPAFAVLARALPDGLYAALLLAANAALAAQVGRAGGTSTRRLRLASGALLAAVALTRPERPLLLASVGLALGLDLVRIGAGGPGDRLRAWSAEWRLPLAVAGVAVLAVMTLNGARWGTFAITDLGSRDYGRAYRALASIDPPHPLRRVPVTREVIAMAAEASPAFRELQPLFANRIGAAWVHASVGAPPGEIGGGWFCWALRDLAWCAGYHQDAGSTAGFYRRIADEIAAAQRAGRLPRRSAPLTFVDPGVATYAGELLPSWRQVWATAWTTSAPAAPVEGAHPSDFDRLAHRRAAVPESAWRRAVRTALWRWYGRLAPFALLLGALAWARLALRVRRGGAGDRTALLGIPLLVAAGLARFALFALIDASSYPAAEVRYLFPGVLLLVAAAAWAGVATVRAPAGAGDDQKKRMVSG